MTSTRSEKDELIQLSSHLICRENISIEFDHDMKRKQMPRKKKTNAKEENIRVSPNVKADCDVS